MVSRLQQAKGTKKKKQTFVHSMIHYSLLLFLFTNIFATGTKIVIKIETSSIIEIQLKKKELRASDPVVSVEVNISSLVISSFNRKSL